MQQSGTGSRIGTQPVSTCWSTQSARKLEALSICCSQVKKFGQRYVTPPPEFSQPSLTWEGVPLANVADLVQMKLTSFRLKDQVHIQDMDSVELITTEIEEQLSDTLRERLAQVRRSE